MEDLQAKIKMLLADAEDCEIIADVRRMPRSANYSKGSRETCAD